MGVYRCTEHTVTWWMYWGIQMYGDILEVYRCMGTYRLWRCTDVWGMYICMGPYRNMGDVWGTYNHTGVHRCMGGCTNVWGAYRHMGGYGVYKCTGGIQMYGGCPDVWGVQMWGSYRHSQIYRQPDIPPHACQLHLGIKFLIKFRFVPYGHILLAHQLAAAKQYMKLPHGSL